MLRSVKTENGWVRGIEAADPRITAFKGIPFAAPPVGENRWRAPQPCENWEGVKEAYRFAPISVQDTPGLGTDIYCREWHVDPDIAMDEDCLYLNVWTPAKSADEKLPVVVWYFGGGFQWGYTAEMEFDGERLARRGIVVVTVNYRLNVFGFMAHPELTKNQPDAPTNFGHLDQREGLLWVRKNIAAFGGDPDNVTIAGQSAGGGSVLAQVASPRSAGLFHKAIIQSAMIRSPYNEAGLMPPPTLQDAEKFGERFFEILGVETLAEARAIPALEIRAKYSEFVSKYPRMFPVQDDVFCVGDPITMVMKNEHNRVPMMAGNTTNEFLNSIAAADEQELAEKVKKMFGEDAEKFLSMPEATRSCGEGRYALVSGLECTVKSVFQKIKENGNPENCYYYSFDADVPGWDNPGTFHSVELWFFFETLAKCWRPWHGAHYDLARQMCNYWSNFVKTGDPNGKDDDGSDMPYWAPYEGETPCNMIFRTAGPDPVCEKESEYVQFLSEQIKKNMLK